MEMWNFGQISTDVHKFQENGNREMDNWTWEECLNIGFDCATTYGIIETQVQQLSNSVNSINWLVKRRHLVQIGGVDQWPPKDIE